LQRFTQTSLQKALGQLGTRAGDFHPGADDRQKRAGFGVNDKSLACTKFRRGYRESAPVTLSPTRNPAAGKAFESRKQSGEHARLTGIFADYSEEVRHSWIRYVGERNNRFIGEAEILAPLWVNLSRSPRVVNRDPAHEWGRGARTAAGLTLPVPRYILSRIRFPAMIASDEMSHHLRIF